MDLGLINTHVPPEQRRRVHLIATADFARVRARMNVDYPTSADEADRTERELKRFLALHILERAGGPFVVGGEVVDRLWHYAVIDTQRYRVLCSESFGGFLDHMPILPEEKASLIPDYRRTREVYRKYFGPPPADIWGDDDLICVGQCHGVRPDGL